MSVFSLPWYAAVGANKALEAELPYLACILIGVVGPTAGRFLIDITSGVTPQHFVRGEWFVGTAVLTSVVYIIADAGLGLTSGRRRSSPSQSASRSVSSRDACGWEEPLPQDPAGAAVLSS